VTRENENYTLASEMDVINQTGAKTFFTTSPNNLQACKLEIFNPFNKKIIDCPTTSNDKFTPKITIATDQEIYKTEEQINVDINVTLHNTGPNDTIKLNYSETNLIIPLINGKASVTLTPKEGDEIITAEYNGYSSSKIISVYRPSKYWHYGIFAFALFFLVFLYKMAEHIVLRRAL
jgi:hypothetical protein